MRIAQISDFHFTKMPSNPLQFLSKRFVGVANWLIRRKKNFHEDVLTSLPKLFSQLKVDLVLIGGDMTSTSLPSEFEVVKKFLSKISQRKLLIPGNHDQYTKGAYRARRFYQTCSNARKNIEHPVEFFTLKEHGVEAHRLENWGWCVALDTAPPTSIAASNGLFSEKLEAYLEEVLDLLGNERILLLNHFPFFQNDVPKHRLLRGDQLRGLIEKRSNIHLYLHGHTHRHSIADLQGNGLPLILDSGCPVQKNGTWNLIDLTPKGCTVQPWHWEQNWLGQEPLSFAWSRKNPHSERNP